MKKYILLCIVLLQFSCYPDRGKIYIPQEIMTTGTLEYYYGNKELQINSQITVETNENNGYINIVIANNSSRSVNIGATGISNDDYFYCDSLQTNIIDGGYEVLQIYYNQILHGINDTYIIILSDDYYNPYYKLYLRVYYE